MRLNKDEWGFLTEALELTLKIAKWMQQVTFNRDIALQAFIDPFIMKLEKLLVKIGAGGTKAKREGTSGDRMPDMARVAATIRIMSSTIEELHEWHRSRKGKKPNGKVALDAGKELMEDMLF